jgi:hypothetical protein
MLSELPNNSLGAYVISMAKTASDVLAVVLLQRECGVREKLRVVPLFETLDDLNNAPHTMKTLFASEWYLNHINGMQVRGFGEQCDVCCDTHMGCDLKFQVGSGLGLFLELRIRGGVGCGLWVVLGAGVADRNITNQKLTGVHDRVQRQRQGRRADGGRLGAV